MAKEFNNSLKTYLRVNSDGLLYKGLSKQEKTLSEPEILNLGFKKVELKDGKITYNKTYGSTDDGYLSYIGIVEKEFASGKVKQLVVTIEGDDSADVITFNLFKQNGNLDDYVKNLATLLPNLDLSKKINVVPSRKKDNRGYTQRNLFVNYPEVEGKDNFVKFAHKYGDDGDIPMAKKTTSVDGSVKYDFTDQDTFLYKVLKEQIERLKVFKGENPNPETDENVQNPTKPEAISQPANLEPKDGDDLPF